MKIHFKQLIVMSFFVFGLTSCKDDTSFVLNTKAEKFNTFPKEDSLSFKNITEYKLGNPRQLFPSDSTLTIYNKGKKSDFLFYNYSLNNNTFSKGYLATGKGPNESIGAINGGFSGNRIWSYDITLKKLITADKTRAIEEATLFDVKEYDIKSEYLKIALLDTLEYSGVGNWGSTSNTIVERKNIITDEILQNYGAYENNKENLDLETVRDIYSSTIHAKPSGGKIVLGYRYSDLIEIYDIKTGAKIALQGPENFPVSFVQEQSSYYYMGKTQETRKAFVNGTVTDKYIYLIYSGSNARGKSQIDRFNWWYGRHIYVYDWDGNPIKKINLDRLVYAIGVSSDDNEIYSYDLNTSYLLKGNLNLE